MERTLNKVELRGHVGTDPKVTELEGVTVIRFPLATHEAYKGKDGQYRKRPCGTILQPGLPRV